MYIAHTPNSFYTCTCKHWFWRFLVVLCVISVAVRMVKARIRLVHFTPVVDKILCTKNGGTQISMVLTNSSFDTKRMMKSNAIIYFFKSYGLFWIYQLLHIQSSPKCRIGCGLLAVSSKTASQDLKKKMVLLFTVIFMSKPLTQCSPIFHP